MFLKSPQFDGNGVRQFVYDYKAKYIGCCDNCKAALSMLVWVKLKTLNYCRCGTVGMSVPSAGSRGRGGLEGGSGAVYEDVSMSMPCFQFFSHCLLWLCYIGISFIYVNTKPYLYSHWLEGHSKWHFAVHAPDCCRRGYCVHWGSGGPGLIGQGTMTDFTPSWVLSSLSHCIFESGPNGQNTAAQLQQLGSAVPNEHWPARRSFTFAWCRGCITSLHLFASLDSLCGWTSPGFAHKWPKPALTGSLIGTRVHMGL